MKLTIQQCFDVPLLDNGIQEKPWIATPTFAKALVGSRATKMAKILKTNKRRHCEEGDSPTWQSMEFGKWIAAALTGPRNDDKRRRHFSKVYPLLGVELLTMTIERYA